VTFSLGEHVGGPIPRQDGIGLVVQDEVAAIRSQHQNCVAIAPGVNDHRHAHGPARQSTFGKELQKLHILTVAVAGSQQVPAVENAPLIVICDRDEVPVKATAVSILRPW
jgi:hypothetical protein